MRENTFNFNMVEKSLENLKTLCALNPSLPSDQSNLTNHSRDIVFDYFNDPTTTGVVRESLGVLVDYISENGSYYQGFSKKDDFNTIVSEVNKCLSLVKSNSYFEEFSNLPEYTKLKNLYEIQGDFSYNFGMQDAQNESELFVLEFNEKDGKTFLNNLVEIKRDASYELFYLKDINSKKFYTDALAQILSKYGRLYQSSHAQDPFMQTVLWNSLEKHRFASDLLGLIKDDLNNFYKFAVSNLADRVISMLHNALMALMMAAKEKTALSESPSKSNLYYFIDFFLFFRSSVILFKECFSESDQNHLNVIFGLIRNFCSSFFNQKLSFKEASEYLSSLIALEQTDSSDNKVLKPATMVSLYYDIIAKEFSKYPSGPVFKALDIISDDVNQKFDPSLLGMFPSRRKVLSYNDYSLNIIGSPCPVTQNTIAYAELTEEFLFYLDSLDQDKLFIVNLQNRLSKKDKARCCVLEDFFLRKNLQNIIFQSMPESEEVLKCWEDQREPIEDFEEFFQLLEQEILSDNSTQYRFIGREQSLNGLFLKELFVVLKETFFKRKKSLFKNDKLLFLDLVSYCLVLKNIEVFRPNSLLAISKDGLDRTASFCFGLETLLDSKICFSNDTDVLKSAFCDLMAPIFVFRDRLMRLEIFELIVKLMNTIRKNKDYKESLKGLFDLDLLNWKVSND